MRAEKQPKVCVIKQMKKGDMKSYKTYVHAFRNVGGHNLPVIVKTVDGKEVIIVPTEGWVTRHSCQGPWDS